MERKHFIPFDRRIGAGIAAVAILTAGVACTSNGRSERPLPTTSPTAVLSSATPEIPIDNTKNLIASGQWAYMPGTEIRPNGLYVEHRDFRIVQQDGSGGQPNPPVNEYGTHLNVPADFSLRFQIADIQGVASLQFYESAPIVSDEFRVEPKSIRLTFDGNKWTIMRWDGNGQQNLANQTPVAQESFAQSPGNKQSVELTHAGQTLTVSANGKQMGTFPTNNTFAGGQLWIGADAESSGGHFMVTNLEADGQNNQKVIAVDTSKFPPVKKRPDGLQELVSKRRKDFKIGANIALWAMASNQQYHDRLFGGDFGVVTPENAGKWQFNEPLPRVYDYHELDAIVAEARKNNLTVHGHNLVFGEALPSWLSNMPTDTPQQKAAVRDIYVDAITDKVRHFKGIIDTWDVNELFAETDDNDQLPRLFKDNVFYRAMGADYAPIGIMAGVKANPNLRVVINEYGTENDDGIRTQMIRQTIKDWVRQGLPITAFGYQSHVYDTGTDLVVGDGKAPVFENNVRAYNAFGVEAEVSEFDAPVNQDDYGTSSQSEQLVGLFRVCMWLMACKEFRTWSNGPSDVYQENSRLQYGEDSMFNAKMQPQRSYFDLQKFLRG